MKQYRPPTLLLTLLLLTACSHSDTKPTLDNMVFEFDAHQSGELTLFELSAKRQIGQAIDRTPISSRREIERKLEKRLAWHLEQNQTCKQGFRELSRSIGVDFAIIRGECI